MLHCSHSDWIFVKIKKIVMWGIKRARESASASRGTAEARVVTAVFPLASLLQQSPVAYLHVELQLSLCCFLAWLTIVCLSQWAWSTYGQTSWSRTLHHIRPRKSRLGICCGRRLRCTRHRWDWLVHKHCTTSLLYGNGHSYLKQTFELFDQQTLQDITESIHNEKSWCWLCLFFFL